MIKVSIIVPVYNVEKYLKRCLDSLVNQTLNEIEILVVNDGSPDNSQKIIDKYTKKYPDLVKSFKKENGGQGSARNYAIKKAKGQYIMYVDSDDFVENNMAKVLYNEAIKTKSDIVICGNNIFSEEYKFIKKESAYYTNNKKDIKENFLIGNMAVWNKLFKKSLITDNNIEFRSKVWYEDLDFNVKCFLKAKKITIVDKPLYNYLIREGSTMNNNNSKRNLEILLALNEIIKFSKENNIYDDETISRLIFEQVLIYTINRVAQQKSKDKKLVIKELINYCKQNINNYKSKHFYKNISKNKKIIAFLNYHNYWAISKILLKINKWRKHGKN